MPFDVPASTSRTASTSAAGDVSAIPGITDLGDVVCIVGAGPAGLSAARALKRLGIPYHQFERHSDVGGLWDITNPGTPLYQSAHFISSRKMSGFFDFPMPASYPDYPNNTDILDYTRRFADHYELRSSIRFNTSVEQVTSDVQGGGDRWLVALSTGEVRRYRAVICANGTNWHPNQPSHPGTFTGEIRHSSTYTYPEEFRHKRVLVVGLGNSGADIACDAAVHADAAFISVRRGYHFIPKHVLGIPADEISGKGPHLPKWLEQPIMGWLVRLLVGDVTRWGLPRPEHKFFESHPLLNSQLLHHLQHGNVRARSDVERFEGRQVVFTDGRRETIDLVLYATGYKTLIPYLPESYFEWAGGRPQAYLTAFNRQHRNLFCLGFLETNSSAYTLFDHVSQMVANYLDDQQKRPAAAIAFEERIRSDTPDLHGGINFVKTDRTQAYVEIDTFKKYIEKTRRQMGWPVMAPGYFDPSNS